MLTGEKVGTFGSRPSLKPSAYVAAAIIIAAIIVATSLVVAPALENTMTTTTTTTQVTSTASPATVTNVVNDTTILPSTATVTTIPMPYPICDHFFWSRNGSRAGNVLLLRPNSTGYVCITFQTTPLAGPIPKEYKPSFPVLNYQPRIVNGSTIYDLIASHSFNVTVLPNSINVSESTNFFTVVVIVKALPNATGFYNDFTAARMGCIIGYLAVASSASQVNSSAFSDITQLPLPNCPAQPFFAAAEFVTGMDVLTVSFPPNKG